MAGLRNHRSTEVSLKIAVMVLLALFSQVSIGSVSAAGQFQVASWFIEQNEFGTNQPPKQLRLTAPSVDADRQYPLVIFQHGTSMYTEWYSDLLDAVAATGYVIIAPQMYTAAPPSSTNTTDEILQAASVVKWVKANEQSLRLPAGVTLDFDNVAITGHSRGGKVAVALARQFLGTNITFQALAALDPVDGPNNPIPFFHDTTPSAPPTSTFSVEHSVDLGFPALLYGSGLGPDTSFGGLTGPCAPAPLDYAQYFKEFAGPTYQFVATNYGHMDFLNVNKAGCPFQRVANCLATWVCPACSSFSTNGPLLTSYLGELVAAFLDSSLKDKPAGLENLVASWQSAPIVLQQPSIYPSSAQLKKEHVNFEAGLKSRAGL